MNESHRIIDLMSHARGELADGCHFLRLTNVQFEFLDLRDVLEDRDRTTGRPLAVQARGARNPDWNPFPVRPLERGLRAPTAGAVGQAILDRVRSFALRSEPIPDLTPDEEAT